MEKRRGIYTPLEIARRIRIKVVPEEKLERWLKKFFGQKVFGQSVETILQELERKGANVVEVVERISIDVFSPLPMKIPAWARSKEKLLERAEVLEDAAQFLEELDYLTGPVFTDRDLKVPQSDHYPERASELREIATELHRLRVFQPGPELIKINECIVGLCELLKEQTGKEQTNRVGYLVKAAFPIWKAGAKLSEEKKEPEPLLDDSVKQILRRNRGRQRLKEKAR